MVFAELVKTNRSYRRFDGAFEISASILHELIDLTRFVASARNQQALKYKIVNTKSDCDLLFPCLAWAGYLKDWDGPIPEERPTAYIVVCKDNTLTDNLLCDEGLAIQTILLGAVEKGLGGCIIASVRKNDVREILSLPPQYEIRYVIALGKPVEKIVVEKMEDNNIRYWRDSQHVHHVPKRSLDDLIL